MVSAGHSSSGWALVTFAVVACHAAPALSAEQKARATQEAPVSAQADAQVVTIPNTGNVRVSSDLELGAGNIWSEGDAGDAPLSAGLWIQAKKVSPERKHHRVKAGQELNEAGYHFKVLEVVKSPERAYVKVEVQPQK